MGPAATARAVSPPHHRLQLSDQRGAHDEAVVDAQARLAAPGEVQHDVLGNVDALAAVCEAHVAQIRKRRGDAARIRSAANVRLLALNLYAAWRQDITLAVAIPRGKP
jgi:hypothetical protein